MLRCLLFLPCILWIIFPTSCIGLNLFILDINNCQEFCFTQSTVWCALACLIHSVSKFAAVEKCHKLRSYVKQIVSDIAMFVLKRDVKLQLTN